MTLSEFKAWFEGFTEGLEAAPTKAQFDRIKAKVADISGTPITQTVYLDRYVRNIPYNQPYWGYPYSGLDLVVGATLIGAVSGNLTGAQGVGPNNTVTLEARSYDGNPGFGHSFDSHSAMHALGKAEAAIN